MNDPTEQKIKGAADELATDQQFTASPFFMSIAAELWLRGVLETVEEVFALLPGDLPSGYPQRSRSTSALLLEEQRPWLLQRRSACLCHFLVSSNPL